MASSPGHPDRQNEDFVGAVPGAVVLLDGAGIPGSEAVCHHGVAWYAHRLGAALLKRLFGEAGVELVAALADSIRHVAELHRHTCDIASPISPQASVAIVRFSGDRVDHLVLADVFVVLDAAGAEPQVVTDPREVNVRSECMRPCKVGLPARPSTSRCWQRCGTTSGRDETGRAGSGWPRTIRTPPRRR